ncbi:MAG: magnesium transporter [Methanobacteriaceae archaeon]|nr:magnesium transporter [Methanobacteriaceae archaeon]
MNSIKPDSNESLESIKELIDHNVPVAVLGTSLIELQSMFSQKAHSFNNINYVYVVDEHNILKGVISIKNILISDIKSKVDHLMECDVITVNPDTDPERVVYMALSNGIKNMPVVDEEKHFLGIISYDNIMKIFNHELESDIFTFGGIFHRIGDEYTTIKSSSWQMVKSRLPWLIIGILGGTVAASVISTFETLLSKLLVLAAFIPVMVYMSDAAGTQSEALIIRGIALDPNLSIRSYFIREFKVATAISLASGIFVFIISIVGWGNPILSCIIGLSMFLSIIAAVCIATLSPLLFNKIKLDPAVATGPLATIFSDIITLAIYFSVALFFFNIFNL